MELFLNILTSIVAGSGIFFGWLLFLIAKKEVVYGRFFLKIARNFLFALMVFFGLYPFSLYSAIFASLGFLILSFYYNFYLAAGFIGSFLAAFGSSSLIYSLVFLYGLLVGSLYKLEKRNACLFLVYLLIVVCGTIVSFVFIR